MSAQKIEPADAWRWPFVVRILHAVGAIHVIALLMLGFALSHLPISTPIKFEWLQFHKALGLAAIAMFAARLLARTATRAPRRAERLSGIARLVQGLLYLLTGTMITTGWIAISASPVRLPVSFFGFFMVPNLTVTDLVLFRQMSTLHTIGAFALLGLCIAHIGAASWHLSKADTVSSRMSLLPRHSKSPPNTDCA